MRLFYIANARIPTEKAHGIQIMKMCEAFARTKTNASQRVEVVLVLPRRFNRLRNDPFVYYGVERIFRIVWLPCIDLISLDFIFGRFALLCETTTFLIAAKIFLLFRPYDVLYSREPLTALFFRNIILELHVLPRRIMFIHRLSLRRVQKFVVLTSYYREPLSHIGIPSSRVFIAPDGVDMLHFSVMISKEDARGKLCLPLDKSIVLYSGSFYLYDWKGVDVILEIAKLNKDFLFVLVGGATEEIEELRKQYLPNNILLYLHRPHQEIPFWLAAADILIIPNKKGDLVSEQFTSPLKLFEYMASQRPIVASNLASLREILSEDNAVLVEPNNPCAFIDAIEKILQRRDFADSISRRAYQDVQNYTWNKRAENIINFISQ